MSYAKQTWDTTSYVTPTRMNHIEDGIESVDTTLSPLADTDTYSAPTTPTNYGSWSFAKVGQIVFLRVNNPQNLTAQDNTLICTLPAKFRPTETKTLNYISSVANMSNAICVRVNINTNGEVNAYNYSTTTSTINIADTKSYPLIQKGE